MGYYINPPSQSKEDFLKEKGTPSTTAQIIAHDYSGDSLPVCLINNGMFTAAGIAYDARERDAFITGMGGRRHSWFTVPKADLIPYYNR